MPDDDPSPPPDPDLSPDEEASPSPEDEPDAPSDSEDLPGPLRTSVGALWALLDVPDDESGESDNPDAEDE